MQFNLAHCTSKAWLYAKKMNVKETDRIQGKKLVTVTDLKKFCCFGAKPEKHHINLSCSVLY